MTSISRSLHLPWSTLWATPPPTSCSTLILASSTINYGATCAFPEEDAPSSINNLDTACLPWLASTTPAPNAFYSPATACPPSWRAVATQTSGLTQGVAGETALSCCPNGFEDGGGGVCKPASTGSFAVVECGEADAEENESRTYTGGSWPTSATVDVPALRVRFRAQDKGETGTATGSGSGTSSSTNSNGGETGGRGLPTGVKAAIGAVVPLAFILLALAIFLLWRRRRHNKAVEQHEKAFAEPKGYSDTKPGVTGSPVGTSQQHNVIGSTSATSRHPNAIETPEWNTELEATEAQRQRAAVPTTSAAHASVSELGGLARKPRKPVPAVELEGSPVPAEMDVSRYMAYQPPRDGAGRS
ncbi:hypothetical protein DPSP01_002483 [Paraphaeosphaeria sporulosa]|uniref:Mid2 domain-containing protein n=1 Tax=Paraphaeosphaeria sporulosa TaxID=1460663 RepID=A0A177CXC0_9PLEO|nr:uncharacterized protein CC84DRAFT_19031 [Paraphaeosphaeria sporulosa]OAG11369.1 hypothetical protein CC84DRAFT_19031 [Paraphaeosphaeria sporulosa]